MANKHEMALEEFDAVFQEWLSNRDAGFNDYGLVPTDFDDDEIRAVGEMSDRMNKIFQALRGLSDAPSAARVKTEKSFLCDLQSSLDEIVLRIGTDEERRSASGIRGLVDALDRLKRSFGERHRSIERAMRILSVDERKS